MKHGRYSWRFALAVAVGALFSPAGAHEPGGSKVCIAHAGASAYAPEHTLAAYQLAIEMKADYIEQDLQLTKNGVLVCIHDASLERTTNVEDVFADRHRLIGEEGKQRKVWPVCDFTLAEIKRLDAGSWFDPKFEDQRVVTFEESIDLARDKIGIYPEIKKSEFIPDAGPRAVAVVARVLDAKGLNTKAAQKRTPVVVQCFHPEMLKQLRAVAGGAYSLVQLVWITQVEDLLSDEGLSRVSKYAQGIGPTVEMLVSDRSRVAAAKKCGLTIHAWSLHDEAPQRFADRRTFYNFLLYDLDIDGLFCDRPDQFPRR